MTCWKNELGTTRIPIRTFRIFLELFIKAWQIRWFQNYTLRPKESTRRWEEVGTSSLVNCSVVCNNEGGASKTDWKHHLWGNRLQNIQGKKKDNNPQTRYSTKYPCSRSIEDSKGPEEKGRKGGRGTEGGREGERREIIQAAMFSSCWYAHLIKTTEG